MLTLAMLTPDDETGDTAMAGATGWRRARDAPGVGRVGLSDAAVGVALVARVGIRAVGELSGRVLVVGLPDTSRARLSDRGPSPFPLSDGDPSRVLVYGPGMVFAPFLVVGVVESVAVRSASRTCPPFRPSRALFAAPFPFPGGSFWPAGSGSRFRSPGPRTPAPLPTARVAPRTATAIASRGCRRRNLLPLTGPLSTSALVLVALAQLLPTAEIGQTRLKHAE